MSGVSGNDAISVPWWQSRKWCRDVTESPFSLIRISKIDGTKFVFLTADVKLSVGDEYTEILFEPSVAALNFSYSATTPLILMMYTEQVSETFFSPICTVDRSIHSLQLSAFTAIPVTGLGGLQGCFMLRIPLCLDNRLTVNCEILATCSSTYSQFVPHRNHTPSP
jgi:hypothetical protein